MRRQMKVQPIPATEAARWLVEFATRDVRPLEMNWHHPEWPAIRARLTAFILNDYASWKEQRQPGPARLLPLQDILSMKRDVENGINQLFRREGGWTHWPVEVRSQSGVLRSPGGEIFPARSEISHSGFMLRVLAVLQAIGPRLRRCEDSTCRHFFVSNRRQVYCTRTCSDRVRSAKWRKEHANDERRKEKVKAQRHAAYVRRVQRRLGDKVKVGSRR